ncbi:glycosyltransferase family 2 protein [Mucilaginibacter sp. 21P]|nr:MULTISPECIES: glycosyltransferase family A protein [Mucilaginibacter]QXV67508.1 glycosyltransferase family 2 protein [Mucilaginibacter sp. 21P]
MEIDSLNAPLVSIIIPVFNGEKYIGDTIRSVLSQSYQQIEVIVISDNSKDDTDKIVQDIAKGGPVRLIRNEKKEGAAASRNVGYKNAKGQFIKFLDGDDLLNDEAIAAQLKLGLKNPDSIISGKWGRFYDNNLSTFNLSIEKCWQTLEPTKWICTSWENGQSMTNPGIFLIPRQLVEKAGLWDESLSLIDDFEYFTRTILEAKSVVFCPDSILYYRSGNGNTLSSAKSEQAYRSAYKSLNKGIDRFLKTRTDLKAKQVCANLWKLFIYEIYPHQQDLAAQANVHLSSLPAPTVKFPTGGLSELLLPFLGWKIVKTLQRIRSTLLT